MVGPLAGLRVLDISRCVAGPYATKLLGDFGADVLKLEPPGGDPSRAFGPFPRDVPHAERSGLFLHLNTNKRSAVLDPSAPEGAEAIRRLAAEADVLVESHAPGAPARWGWGWEALRAVNPRLAMVSISPFGQTGPYRDYRGSEITLQAIGGPLHATGNRDREPLKLAGHYAQYHAGLSAALAALTVHWRVAHGGTGDWVDLAIYECQMGCRDRRTIQLVASEYNGTVPQRMSTEVRRMASGMRACLDGFVNLTGGGTRLPKMLRLIGREDLLDHPDVGVSMLLSPPGLAAEVEASYEAYLAQHTKLQAVEEAQALGILAGAVMTVSDLIENRAHRERGYWEEIDHPESGPLLYPGRPFRMSLTPRPLPRRAPLLGEHQADLASPWPARADASAAAPASPRPARVAGGAGAGNGREPGRLPLEGIRIADITVVWAGPHVTQLLAEWGAEVIRVEPVNRIQPSTRGAENIVTKEQALGLAAQGLQPQYPDMEPGDEPWNRSASFTSHARNKKSMACDIGSPAGREAFLRLIERCDVLVENNVPETIDKMNIGWEVLREINPRLVMVRMPAYGLDGPYRNYRAFGLHVEAMVGHTHLRGYPDATPEGLGETLASDGISGVQGAVAALMALLHRERTGDGQLIEMPLTEGFIATLAEFVLDHSMNGVDPPPQANRHRWHAPHAMYPCAGVDQWIAIDVGTDEEFAALCRELGREALARDARFATAEARREHRAALDAAVAEATREREKEALFHALQRAGVCAAPAHDPLEALADPHLAARSFFEELDTPGGGRHRYPGLTFRMAETPNRLRTPPVTLGQHNEEIYLELLGYPREQYDALVAKGLVGTRYPDALLRRR